MVLFTTLKVSEPIMNSILNKSNVIIGTVALLILLSWSGFIDKHSSEYVDGAVTEAGASYAAAQGINATVSVLQSGTIDFHPAGIGTSISVGEALDPFNDLIERFSQAISVAIGSLILQKILLVLVSHGFFKILITLSGLLIVGLILLKKYKHIGSAVRFFIVTVFIRFSLVFVLALNSIVDSVFLDEQIKEGASSLESLEKGLASSSSNKLTKIELTELNEDSDKIKNKINLLNVDIKNIEVGSKNSSRKIESFNVKISIEDEKLEILKNLASKECGGLFTQVFSDDAPECKNAKSLVHEKATEVGYLNNEIHLINISIDNDQEKIESINDQISDLQDHLQGNNDKISGKTDWWESAANSVKIDTDKIMNNISGYIQDILKLLVLFLLKTILIPIGFFYMFSKVVKAIWSTDWNKVLKSNFN